MIGTTLSHYKLLGEISRGGMGIVYRALDTKLDREVALKVLPPDLVRDAERKRRFVAEAKAAAKLNHPAIAVVYEIDDAENTTFIAMELIPGKMLSDVLGGEKLPVSRCLELAVEIAEGLARAHEKGIVHRDLKPANLMVTDDGHIKIIDFGLAKLVEQVAEGQSEVGTQIKGDTKAGQVLGTIAYMSPEQARGQTVDARTDIFSFGSVLYEMLCSEPPFQGPSGAETMSAIINESAPSLSRSVKGPLVPAVSRIVERCLEKDPDDRYQTAKDLASELRRAKRDSESGARVSSVASEPAKSRVAGRAVVAALALGVAVVALYLFRPREGAPPSESFPRDAVFSQLTSQPGPERFPSLSPDGRSLVYSSAASGNEDVYLLRVGGENPINLTADSEAADSEPTFSPDGDSIAFRSERQGGGIFLMGATGESVRRLTDFGFNPSWSPDGKEIVFASERVVANPRSRGRGSQLWVASLEGQKVRQISVPDGVQPSWSPSGHRIAFWAQTTGQRDIWTISAEGGEPVAVTSDSALDWNPVWAPDGRYLYYSSTRGGTMNLWRVPIEERTGSPLGTPEPVTTGVTAESMHLTISRDGKRLAYASELVTANIVRAAFDPETLELGEPSFVTEGSVTTLSADASPDGTWLCFYRFGGQEDIFIVRPDGTGMRQLTQDEFNDRVPRWSPDGSRIAFYSNRSGTYQIWTIHPDGSGLEQVTDDPRSPIYPTWSPDGKHLAVSDLDSGWFFVPFPPDPTAEAPPLLPSIGDGEVLVARSWSPDGNWIAGERRFLRDHRSSGIVVYSLATGEYELVSESGTSPSWWNDSRTIVFSDVSNVDLGGAATLFLVDRVSKTPRTVPRREIVGGPEFSRDGRTLYYSTLRVEGDLWLVTLP